MARDPRISEIFYYFEKHTDIASGRTVGRKIGVVQEILCKKLLLTSSKVRDAIIYEPKLPGHSGATHKVEFVVFQPLGVTEISVGQSFSPVQNLSITVVSADSGGQKVKLKISGPARRHRTLRTGQLLKIGDYSPENGSLLLKVVSIDTEIVRLSLLDPLSPVASIESKRVGAQRFSGSKQLGSGIQTIEKAKQASLVAVDFDLRFNKSLLAHSKPASQRSFRSFVILGNGVHWTPHDLAVLSAYVDYTYQVDDKAVLRYAEFVRRLSQKAGEESFQYFMRYFQGMTKTPADKFTVREDDFLPVRPENAGPLLPIVENQIQPYPVNLVEN